MEITRLMLGGKGKRPSTPDDAGAASDRGRGANAARIGGTSVHASVANEIGLRIVRGDYPPGTILPNEAKWSETFEVSRSAVREAIKMLMAKSLLSSRPKIGSWVEPRERWNLLDRDVLAWYCDTVDFTRVARDVQQIRFMIEPEAAALAATNRSTGELGEIEEAFVGMAAAANQDEWNIADVRFHLGILNASGNDFFVPFGRAIESLLANLFMFTTAAARSFNEALPQHEAILKAIRDRKPDAARRAVRRLLDATEQTIENSKRRGVMRKSRVRVRA
jgi:DNA-binding FadR family transcriptional regulator